MTSNSIPNHSIENYCSAQGGNLPPLIGTDSNKTQTHTATRLPSNAYLTPVSNVVGMAVNGVLIFSPFTAVGTVAATDETLDVCSGHQANGVYHYHGFSECIFGEDVTVSNPEHSPIYGWSLDGFPIYGPMGYADPYDPTSPVVRIETGYELTGSDDKDPSHYSHNPQLGYLDQCNGRYTVTPEFPDGMYVYYLNVDENADQEFPGVPYCHQTSDP